jgi:hypothetical protein
MRQLTQAGSKNMRPSKFLRILILAKLKENMNLHDKEYFISVGELP